MAGEAKIMHRDDSRNEREAELDVETVLLALAVEPVPNDDDEPGDRLIGLRVSGLDRKRVGEWRVGSRSSFPGAHKHYSLHFYSPHSPAIIKFMSRYEGREKRAKQRETR